MILGPKWGDMKDHTTEKAASGSGLVLDLQILR